MTFGFKCHSWNSAPESIRLSFPKMINWKMHLAEAEARFYKHSTLLIIWTITLDEFHGIDTVKHTGSKINYLERRGLFQHGSHWSCGSIELN